MLIPPPRPPVACQMTTTTTTASLAIRNKSGSGSGTSLALSVVGDDGICHDAELSCQQISTLSVATTVSGTDFSMKLKAKLDMGPDWPMSGDKDPTTRPTDYY